uniref:Uncharacterized protein n=1 Tax=viral metagenome TaxID=1070528 RepID=A0A6M3LR34_9ZZZZ
MSIFCFNVVFLVVIGLFLMIIWKVPINEIGFWRWLIGWGVSVNLLTEMHNIQQYFLG